MTRKFLWNMAVLHKLNLLYFFEAIIKKCIL
jgi:hypothetical protein